MGGVGQGPGARTTRSDSPPQRHTKSRRPWAQGGWRGVWSARHSHRAHGGDQDSSIAIRLHSGPPGAIRARTRTVGALNHAHICTLFDVGRQDGTDFLVGSIEGHTYQSRGSAQQQLSLQTGGFRPGSQSSCRRVDGRKAHRSSSVFHRRPWRQRLCTVTGKLRRDADDRYGDQSARETAIEGTSAVPPDVHAQFAAAERVQVTRAVDRLDERAVQTADRHVWLESDAMCVALRNGAGAL